MTAFVGDDLDRKVVLYCLRGVMSNQAGAELVEAGYRAVTVLEGGMEAWLAAGYTLEPED